MKFLDQLLDNQSNYLLLCLLSAWVVNRFDFDMQIMISTFALLSLGLFHGVFDLEVVGVTSKRKWRALLIYLLSLGGIALILFAHKPTAIALLILISSFHFGEDFIEKNRFKIPMSILVGSNLLAWFFLINLEELNQYFEQIGFSVYLNKDLFLLINGMLSLICYFLLKTKQSWYLLNIVLVILLSLSTGLIASFSIYFCLGHSLPSTYKQVNFFEKKLNGKQFKKTMLNGLFIFLIALSAIVGFWFLEPIEVQADFILNSLIYLMMLSVPHSVIMHQLDEAS